MSKRRVHALRLVFSVSCADVRFQSLSQPFSAKIRSEQLQNTNEEQLILEGRPLLSFAAFIGCYHQVGAMALIFVFRQGRWLCTLLRLCYILIRLRKAS